MAKKKTKKTERQPEKKQLRQRQIAKAPEHAHAPPRWKPLARDLDLDLFRAQWLHRHVPGVLDREPAPGSTTNLSWPGCEGQVPWGALKRIWVAEEAAPDSDTRCLLCDGPLATYGLAHLLFTGWWFRCCLDCGVDYESGMGIGDFMDRRRRQPLGPFATGGTKISFAHGHGEGAPGLEVELELGPLEPTQDGMSFQPLRFHTPTQAPTPPPEPPPARKKPTQRQRERSRARWQARAPTAPGTYAVATWDGRQRSVVRVVWAAEEAKSRPERDWSGWWYGLSFERAWDHVPEIWAELARAVSAEPAVVEPRGPSHRPLQGSRCQKRPSSAVRSSEPAVTKGEDQ